MQARTVALIPAAGQGRRLGGPLEKQFLLLGGRPLLARTVAPFQRSPFVHEILLVVPGGWIRRVEDVIVRPFSLSKVKKIVPGGRERQESVRLGLQAIDWDCELVLIHDGARPLVTEEIIARSVQETAIHGATLMAVPATDTIKQVDTQGHVQCTLARERLWMAQTPQAFIRDLIVRAHREAQEVGFLGTDDASLVERLGHPVWVLTGSHENLKITTPRDLRLAEEILAERERTSGA